MIVELIGIIDRGDPDKERVHFKALADLDLTKYAIIDTMYSSPSTIQAANRNCYWLPPGAVKANSNVVVYTRAGTPNQEIAEDGVVSHFLFRNLGTPIYADPKSTAVLCEMNGWATSKAAPGVFG